jgi:hypothetical protein
MYKPVPSSSIILAIIFVALALTASGCSNPLSGPTPKVTVTAPYIAPSSTPVPVATPLPTPEAVTNWTGLYVKLYGNVSVASSDHVYGSVKISYLEEEYWDEYPTVKYDTDEGGAYSLDVRANVPFKVTIGYLYVGRLPQVMNTKLIDDKIYTVQEDTRLDFEVMTSNIMPVK